MATQLINILAAGVTDDNGEVVASGYVYFYEAQSSTLATVYQDVDLSEPHANPAVLDAAGRLIAYTDEAVKCVITDASDNSIRTVDNATTGSLLTTTTPPASAEANEVILGDGDTVPNGTSGYPLVCQGTADDPEYAQLTVSGIADDAIETIKIKDAQVTAAKLATDAVETAKIKDANVTRAKLAALGQQLSSTSGGYTQTSVTETSVTNLSVSITTTGRPVFVAMISDASASASCIGVYNSAGTSNNLYSEIYLYRAATKIANWQQRIQAEDNSNNLYLDVPTSLVCIDTPAAGTYTYAVKAKSGYATTTLRIAYVKLIAFEL